MLVVTEGEEVCVLKVHQAFHKATFFQNLARLIETTLMEDPPVFELPWCLVLGLRTRHHWQFFSTTYYTILNTNYSFFKFTSLTLNQNNVPMIWYSIRGIWRFYRSKNLEGILKGKSALPSPVSCPELWNPGLEFTWL